MKNSKGISLIALIITIIVIVILAAVVVTTSIDTPKSASFAVFCSNISEVQQEVSLKYADLYTVEVVSNSGVDLNSTEIEALYKQIFNATAATTVTEGSAMETDLEAALGVPTLPAIYAYDGAGSGDPLVGNAGLSGLYITAGGKVFMYPGFDGTDAHYITAGDNY